MKKLYPEINPYQKFFLQTGSKHSVYVEVSGNPNGIPVVFLHGGPCSGTKPDHRRFFNPELYRIILFDQRGCGQSLPFGEIEKNTTQDLIDDMERIRKNLGIVKWHVFGGSWGAALALLYAQQHVENVVCLTLRGVFLVRQQDMDWFISTGANRIYPEKWQELSECVLPNENIGFVESLWWAINGEDVRLQKQVAFAWQAWNGQVALGEAFVPRIISDIDHDVTDVDVKQVRMELHYAMNRYFIGENQILQDCDRLQNTPAVIIHGRNDLVCPLEAAASLHKALPHAELIVLTKAGHIAQHEEMIDALVDATDRFAGISN